MLLDAAIAERTKKIAELELEIGKLQAANAVLNGHATTQTFNDNPIIKAQLNFRPAVAETIRRAPNVHDRDKQDSKDLPDDKIGSLVYPESIKMRRRILGLLKTPQRPTALEAKLDQTGSTIRNHLEAMRIRGLVRKEGIFWSLA